ncbi:MAG: tol-pal system YbgF family protein [Bdellovibrionales bacterium]
MMQIRVLVLTTLVLGLLGCGNIKTRSQINDMARNVGSGNTSTSNSSSSSGAVETPVVQTVETKQVIESQTLNDSLRDMSGQIQFLKATNDGLNREITALKLSNQEMQSKMDTRFKMYDESLVSLEERLLKIQTLKAQKPVSKVKPKQGIFERAEAHMATKNWKKAIVEFDNYLKKYPRGRRASLATYNIGFSFESLGLTDDAKEFYKETLAKYPKTTAGKKARERMKKIK